MYSGADFKTHFNKLWGTSQSGSFSDIRLNEFFVSGQIDYYYPLMKSYGLNNEVNEQCAAYLLTPNPFAPISNTLDKSETSTTLPNFQRLIYLRCKFIKNTEVYNFFATELADDEVVNVIITGSIMYPKYEQLSASIRIYPASEVCTLVEVKYFRTPFLIDVTSSTKNLPFSQKNFESIVEQTLQVASRSNREPEYYQEVTMENKNNAPA